MPILKTVHRIRHLTEPAKREVDRWYPADLRDFLECIIAGAHGANERTSIEASEALAYLNWRENRRLTDLNGGKRLSQPFGGERCHGETFRLDDPTKLTGCETSTDRVIEKPASRHGEQR